MNELSHHLGVEPSHLREFDRGTTRYAGYLVVPDGFDLLVTGEFVALWTRQWVDTTVERVLVGIVGRVLVGIVGRVAGTAMWQIPYRLSIGCHVGGHTCGPLCARGSREMGADDESEFTGGLDGDDSWWPGAPELDG